MLQQAHVGLQPLGRHCPDFLRDASVGPRHEIRIVRDQSAQRVDFGQPHEILRFALDFGTLEDAQSLLFLAGRQFVFHDQQGGGQRARDTDFVVPPVLVDRIAPEPEFPGAADGCADTRVAVQFRTAIGPGQRQVARAFHVPERGPGRGGRVVVVEVGPTSVLALTLQQLAYLRGLRCGPFGREALTDGVQVVGRADGQRGEQEEQRGSHEGRPSKPAKYRPAMPSDPSGLISQRPCNSSSRRLRGMTRSFSDWSSGSLQ